VGGKQVTWLGSAAAQLRVAAPEDVEAILVVDVAPGPSARPAKLQISGAGAPRSVTLPGAGPLELPVSLTSGVNELTLRAVPLEGPAPDASDVAWKPFGVSCVSLRR
jgi:hypothetical protein